MKKISLNLLIISAALSIAACDSAEPTLKGSINNPESEGLITLVGLIKMEPNSLDADFSRGVFGQLETGLTAQVIESSFAPTTDTCEVNRYTAVSNEPVPPLVIFDQQPPLISAGENIIVSSVAGTYATLNRQNETDNPFYKTDVPLSGEAPTGLSVDVPGDQYPAFSNVAFTDVVPLQFTGPAQGQSITPNTEFTWIANNINRSVIEIYLGNTNVQTNEVIEVGCTVVDDGRFTFSSELRDDLGTDFSADWSAYLRIAYNVVRQGNAILFTANSIDSQ